MNKIILTGNLTRDPELRVANLPTGQVDVCTFCLAQNDRGSGQAQYIDVTVWRKLAQQCCKQLQKGSKVLVVGRATTRAYTDKEGNSRSGMDVAASEVEFLGGLKPKADAASAPAEGTAPAHMQPIMDDDLPF